MDANFEKLISNFLENQVGILDDFMSVKLALNLKSNLIKLHDDEKLRLAGIGNDQAFNRDIQIRKDKIFWLDKLHNDRYENEFFELIDSFVLYLNQSCYAGIKNHEFHYALYEKGAFYKKHLDQFKSNDKRSFSMIMYLNEGWVKEDGGELKVYHATKMQIITPNNQKCVFFRSNELEHEVLQTNVPRMSITGWLNT